MRVVVTILLLLQVLSTGGIAMADDCMDCAAGEIYSESAEMCVPKDQPST